MFYYKDQSNKIHELESTEFEHLLPVGCVQITKSEANSLINTPDVQREKQRGQYKKARDASLEEITHDFGDGRVVQVRPQDVANFQLAVSLGVSQEWVMSDNTIATLTPAELQTALDGGITQGKVIWQTYIDSLKAL